MNEINTLNELMTLHEEFLNSRYFLAPSIMTPREEWLSIDRNDTSIEEAYKEAKERNIFNLVVTDGKHVSGFINVKYIRLRNGKYEIEWDSMENVEDHSVPETCHLFGLLKIMVKDAKQVERQMSPLYFVVKSQGNDEEPTGIISFWDLNRAPAYILSYPILVYLEHTLIIIIEKSHISGAEHGDLFDKMCKMFSFKKQEQDRFRRFLDAPRFNYSVLSKLGLPELAYFYENDPHIKNKNKIPKDLLYLFTTRTDKKRFRNIIAHTINLIVDSKNFRQDLEDLDKIWNYGKELFCNFIDPKVSYSPPFLNET
jgi:CBS domain-containing protein